MRSRGRRGKGITPSEEILICELYRRQIKLEVIVAASRRGRTAIQRLVERRGIERRKPGRPVQKQENS